MAIHRILEEPHPLLHKISDPVRVFDAGLGTLLEEMLETMYASQGIGLAAPQIGLLQRALVIDLGEAEGASQVQQRPLKIVNPEIIWASNKDKSYTEGCLSIPDHYVDVVRPEEVRVRYQDETGAFHELRATGLLAVCLQHEMDHLDGITLLTREEAQKKNAALRALFRPS